MSSFRAVGSEARGTRSTAGVRSADARRSRGRGGADIMSWLTLIRHRAQPLG